MLVGCAHVHVAPRRQCADSRATRANGETAFLVVFEHQRVQGESEPGSWRRRVRLHLPKHPDRCVPGRGLPEKLRGGMGISGIVIGVVVPKRFVGNVEDLAAWVQRMIFFEGHSSPSFSSGPTCRDRSGAAYPLPSSRRFFESLALAVSITFCTLV